MKKLNLVNLSIIGLILFSSTQLQAQSPKKSVPIKVEFCNLVQHPEKYHKKLIRVDAISLSIIVPTLDGGGSFYYSPKCNDIQGKYFVEASGELVAKTHSIPRRISRQIFKLEHEDRSENKEAGRVHNLVTGIFEMASSAEGGFGHLGAFQYRILTVEISKVRKVAKTVPWPGLWK